MEIMISHSKHSKVVPQLLVQNILLNSRVWNNEMYKPNRRDNINQPSNNDFILMLYTYNVIMVMSAKNYRYMCRCQSSAGDTYTCNSEQMDLCSDTYPYKTFSTGPTMPSGSVSLQLLIVLLYWCVCVCVPFTT